MYAFYPKFFLLYICMFAFSGNRTTNRSEVVCSDETLILDEWPWVGKFKFLVTGVVVIAANFV